MPARLVVIDKPAVHEALTMPTDRKPALLVSFFYLDKFLKHQKEYQYRDWVMDSGAFSAFNSGQTIDLPTYIETCLRLQKTDPKLTEIYSLDVIGDEKASLRNTELMWKAGVQSIPTYHLGEPVDALMYLAKTYPKIAIGGVALKKGDLKTAFAQACFSRVWPKKIHGFGFGSEKHIMAFPFHSTDATNWELGPCAFGRWNSFGKMSVRGSHQNLRAEVEYYLRLEEKARSRWAKEMRLLRAQTVRLGMAMSGRAETEVYKDALTYPKIHLAHVPGAQGDHTLKGEFNK